VLEPQQDGLRCIAINNGNISVCRRSELN
jgi:hypothetical protein